MPPGFSPGDARGGAPCIRKQKIPPFPAGEERSASAGRGDRGKNKAKGRGSRQPNRQAPRWAPAPQVQPVPLPAQARGCKGRSPLHKITLVSPFPAGEGGRGDRGQESKLKAGGNRRQSRQVPRWVQRRQGQPATKSTHPNSKMHESTVPPPASGCKTPIFRKMAKIACIIHKYAVKYRIGVGKDSPHSHIHREPALRKAERKCLAECPGFP